MSSAISCVMRTRSAMVSGVSSVDITSCKVARTCCSSSVCDFFAS
jgi:hypothetical protein